MNDLGLKERWDAFYFSLKSPMTKQQWKRSGQLMYGCAVLVFSVGTLQLVYGGYGDFVVAVVAGFFMVGIGYFYIGRAKKP